MYAGAPAHITCFILGADSAQKVRKFLVPIVVIGTAEITPTTDLAEEVKTKIEEAKRSSPSARIPVDYLLGEPRGSELFRMFNPELKR
jgi:hypothetical protein